MTSLTSIPALRSLPPGTVDAVVGHSRPMRLHAGAVVRHAGEPAHGVLLLLSGAMVAAYSGPSGSEVWPERWEAPAIVDKPAVLVGGPAPTRLFAVTRVAARLLPRDRFLRLLDEQEPVRTHVMTKLAHATLSAQARLAQATTLPAVAQVAAWLAADDLAHTSGWRGSQDDLARTLGLSRVTVNRALARLTDAGALRVSPGRVTVVSRRRLRLFVIGP